MILYGHDRAMMAWASERLGRNLYRADRRAMGVIRDMELMAVVVFSEFRWPDIHASVASTSPRWVTRDHLRQILRYPFIQLGCKRVTAVTEATNQSARTFLCRLGFRQEGIHIDGAPTCDAVSYGLLARDAARWLTEESNVERQSISSGGA